MRRLHFNWPVFLGWCCFPLSWAAFVGLVVWLLKLPRADVLVLLLVLVVAALCFGAIHVAEAIRASRKPAPKVAALQQQLKQARMEAQLAREVAQQKRGRA